MSKEKTRIFVKITDGKRTHSEDVTEEQKEYFEEISTNGANPDVEGKTFEWWVRPIKSKATDLDKYNTRDDNAHFIYGWFESFAQSDNVPQWMYDADDNLQIEVKNIKPPTQ